MSVSAPAANEGEADNTPPPPPPPPLPHVRLSPEVQHTISAKDVSSGVDAALDRGDSSEKGGTSQPLLMDAAVPAVSTHRNLAPRVFTRGAGPGRDGRVAGEDYGSLDQRGAGVLAGF